MSKQNIVKETAKELGLTYDELGELIGVNGGTLTNSASSGKISNQTVKSLLLLKENIKYKEDFRVLKDFKKLIES